MLARAGSWNLVEEALARCWEQDFIQWVLMSRAGFLFKYRFTSWEDFFFFFFLDLGHSGSSLESRLETEWPVG